MPDSNDNIDNTDGPGEQTDGPIFTPITVTPSTTGPVTAFITIPVTISMKADEAGSTIAIEYLEDDNPPQPIENLPQVTIPASDIPTALWSSSSKDTVTGSFEVKIDAAQVANFTNPQYMDLVIQVTSGNGQGNARIRITL